VACRTVTPWRAYALTLLTFVGTTVLATAADGFHKLTQTQIRARLAGKEITDGVHWAEQYMRDGTFKAFHMGKATAGRWSAHNGELCLELTTVERECKEVWLSGTNVEFRVPGSGLPPFEGVLKRQEPRS
jgi:hypothetical protein